MNENLRTAAVESEVPVNPYSLLEAVNRSSDTAHTAWLIFIGIMSYMLVAVAGVTHKDLLLSNDIGLPILQVNIGLTRFFLFAPILIVLFHLGVVSQLVMLARKTLEFDTSIRMLEVSDKRSHPLRLELHNFFFVQAIAGPQRSPVMSAFLHAMSWLTLVILPVILLLYVQVAFLPYHDVMITWAHRVALAADIVMLVLIGVFLMQPETSFLWAVGYTIRRHPFSLLVTFAVFVLVSAFSFLVATVPGERLDLAAQALSRTSARADGPGGGLMPGFAIPVLGSRPDGSLLGGFERNLNVADVDLVVDKDVSPGEASIVLRGRDLRYARLDRADMHQADLTGSNLEGASLVGTDLRNALLQCGDIDQLVLTEDRRKARCAGARGANLAKARLSGARMGGIDLTGAKLEEADLEAADLNYAVLAGANLYSARLMRAALTGGISAQGANFATAMLQGADLTGAKLAGADLTSAGLQGATLAYASLQGTVLRDADLEAANLTWANLHGANFRNAKVRAADLRGATIWMTVPPRADTAELADLSQLALKPLGKDEITSLNASLATGDKVVRGQVEQLLVPVLAGDATKPWTDAADQGAWQTLGTASAVGQVSDYKGQLTQYLSRVMCKPIWADGSVATGIFRRALRPDFRGDMPALYDRLQAGDCPASKAIAPAILHDLASAVDLARGN